MLGLDVAPRSSSAAEAARNKRFQQYVKDIAVWKSDVKDGEEIVGWVKDAIVDAVVRLTKGGVTAGRTGARTSIDSLNWESLDLRRRKTAIEATTVDYLRGCDLAIKHAPEAEVHLRFGEVPALCRVHAVPEALSYGPARDMVGQVFRDDHAAMPRKGNLCGPVHVVACQRGVTRGQARKLLGVEDATYIDTPFGVFMADELQQVQVFLVKDCRDPTATRTNLAACIAWLKQGAQVAKVGARARLRKTLVTALQTVLEESERAAVRQ